MGWRPKDIARKLADKENLGQDEINEIFGDFEFLSNKNGFNLCLYIALHRLSVEDIWAKVCDLAVNSNMNRKHCELLGRLIFVYYIKSPEFEEDSIPNGHRKAWKELIAEELFKPLMECCVLGKKAALAESLRMVFRSLVLEQRADLNRRLFKISKGLVWRYLDSPNDTIRMGAFYVQQNLFPPTSEDSLDAERYFSFHLNAFISALEDLSLPVRLMSLENVMEKFSYWFDETPPEFRKRMREVLDTLVSDVNVKTRAAIFKAFRFFAAQVSIPAKNWAKEVLKVYVPNGVDDVKEKVRLSAFKLLNSLNSDPEFDVYYLVDLPAILNRLDFEESREIELEIGKLLCEKWFGSVSYVQKFLNVSQLCKINRNAALDLHRVIIGEEIMSKEKSLSYICGLSEFLPMILNKYCGDKVDLDFDLSREFNSQSNDKKLESLKDVIDCLVVSYTLLQPDLKEICGTQSSDIELTIIQRRFSEAISIIFDKFSDNEGLMDTALTLATMSPKVVNCMPKFKLDTERQLRSGRLDDKRLQVFAMADMDKVVHLMCEGLDQCKRTSEKFIVATPSPAKRPRLSSVFLNEETVIDALNSLICTSVTKDYLFTTFITSLNNIVRTLCEIRENYLLSLRPKRTRFNSLGILVKTIDLLTVLLVFKFTDEKEPEEEKTTTPKGRRKKSLNNSVGTPKSANRKRKLSASLSPERYLQLDPLTKDVDLYSLHFKSCPEAILKKVEVSEAILRSIGIMAKSFVHEKRVLEEALRFVEGLKQYKTSHPRIPFPEPAYDDCCQSIDHALGFALESAPFRSPRLSFSPEL
uniref:Condensin complex subunit 1 n=1 Tax=Bursaphelenchus xylophilus TaxID=6326 RepID=A0A1I7RHU8_BURXY